MTEFRRRSIRFDRFTQTLIGRLIREFVRPQLRRLLAAAWWMSIAAAASAGNAWMLKPAIDDVFVAKDRFMLLMIPLAVVAIGTIKGFATYGHNVLMSYAGQRIIADVQRRLYGHLIHSDIAFFHETPTGSLISRFITDTGFLRAAVSSALTGIVKDSLTLIFLVGVMFYQDWSLALIAFLAFPFAVLPIRNVGRKLRRVSSDTQIETGRFAALLDQTLSAPRHVKAYGMEAYEIARANSLIEKIFRLVYKAARQRSIMAPALEALGSFAIALVIWYGGSQVIAGETTPGTFFSFIAALIMAYQPVKNLANLNAALQEGLAAAERLYVMLDAAPKILNGPGARPLAVAGGGIRFDNVTFSYRTDAPALADVTFEIPAGKTAALVGPSGAGKSTVLNLIPRFYDVDSGCVRIDGQDVRDVTFESVRHAIALVSQEVALFDDTVRANIAYGRPDAREEEIAAAAEQAAAHGFIREMPDGYDTMIGEGGVRLSGGQRQRIAIARAILKNAPILLLDEATSALDTESERHIQRALGTLMTDRTTLVIAHRLSTVMAADVIFVMDNGRIVDRGSHAELLARGGLYARLYALQFADSVAEEAPERAHA